MSISAPHFLLHTEAKLAAVCAASAAGDSLADGAASSGGGWRFMLKLPSGETSLEAADEEADASGERLELLALVRGLEALEQPSRVTLVTASDHVQRGLRFGLAQWRENGWHWERFGRMSPVKNCDLWQRIDRLTDIHQLDCRAGRMATADDLAPAPAARVVHHRGQRLRFDEPAIGCRNDQITSTKPVRAQSRRSKVHGPVELGSVVLGALSRLVSRYVRSRITAR